MKTITFHIYKKGTNEVIKHSLTLEEIEKMMAEKTLDWSQWEVQPCYTDYSAEDASF
tara:strand:- start:904 stop:1074 length:171 start_codon:yes stop_codon:yes gene_type:complete